MHRLYIFILAGLLTVLAACTDDRLTDGMGNESVPVGQEVYLSLTVAAGDASRSRAVGTPTPGEDGDGTQEGTGDENVIADLNVFFFDAGGDETGYRPGINAMTTANAPVITFYTDELLPVTLSDGGTGYTTGSRKLEDMGINLQMGKTYDVLVLANYGKDYGEEYAEGHPGQTLTLATLRDAVIEAETVTTDAEGLRSITSSTSRIIRNGKYFLMASAGAASITVAPGTVTATVTLERLAARVDYWVKSEYAAKVKEDPTAESSSVRQDKVKITGAVLCNDYAGAEYLFKHVSPRITTIQDWNDITPAWLGTEQTNVNDIANNYVLDPTTATGDKTEVNDEEGEEPCFVRYHLHHTPAGETDWTNLSTSENSETYHTLGYTRENVTRVTDNTRPETALYVVFRAEYTPAEIDGTANEVRKTFYWYNNQAYTSLNTLQKANSTTVPEGITDQHLTDYGIHKYTDGICYYTYYIRHADDGDPNTESPMEHATVRNNVYRLQVNSVSGPGGSGEIVVTVTLADWRDDINVYPEF